MSLINGYFQVRLIDPYVFTNALNVKKTVLILLNTGKLQVEDIFIFKSILRNVNIENIQSFMPAISNKVVIKRIKPTMYKILHTQKLV